MILWNGFAIGHIWLLVVKLGWVIKKRIDFLYFSIVLFSLRNTFQFYRIHHTILSLNQNHFQKMDNPSTLVHPNNQLNHRIIQLMHHPTQHIHPHWLIIQTFRITVLQANSIQDLLNLFQMFSIVQILNFTLRLIHVVVKNISFVKTTGYTVINVVKVSTGTMSSISVIFLLKHSVILDHIRMGKA